MDIEELSTFMVSQGLPNSPRLTNSDSNVTDETPQCPAVPTVSPLSTPLAISTNDLEGCMTPLCIYAHVAGESGVLDGGISPVSAVVDAAGTDMPAISDEVYQSLPTHLAAPDGPIENAEVSRDSLDPEDIDTLEDHADTLEDQLDPESHIEKTASESRLCVSPDSEPANPSYKGSRAKRRTKPTVDLDSLPALGDGLTDAEIASLCYQPPRVRQRYTTYFASHGVIRTAYVRILFERLPDGQLRFPEDVLRSCLPKWKDRLDAYETAESSQAGVGRKRKGKTTAAKRRTDDDTEFLKHSPKKARKATASKSDDVHIDQRISEASTLPHPVPNIRIRPVITERTARSMGRRPGIHTSQSSTVRHADSSEHVPKELSKASASVSDDETQNFQHDPAVGLPVHPDVPNMDNCRPFFSSRPAHSTPVFHPGGSQLLDPNYLGQFAQNLTGEIQQLDLATVAIVLTSHDEGPYWRFRRLRDTLVQLRDQCVDIEAKLRKYMAGKDT